MLISGLAVSVNYHAIDHRPNFITLGPQQMSETHRNQASLGHNNALVSASYINFHFNALSVVRGAGKNNFFDLESTEISGQKIALRVPGLNQPLLLTVQSVQHLIRDENIITYTGYVADSSNDYFILSILDDVVMAKINHGEHIYIITPLDGNNSKHSIAQLHKGRMIKDNSNDVSVSITDEPEAKAPATNHANKSVTGSGQVDVLFYVASDVNYPGIYVSLIVAEMNWILQSSQVSNNNQISSVGIKVLSSSFTGMCKLPIEIDILSRSNVFGDLNNDLIAYGADIMFLIVTTQPTLDCSSGFPTGDGIQWGRVGGKGFPFYELQPWAFSTDTYALGDLTAVHEFGHVFDGIHNSKSVNTSPAPNQGKTFLSLLDNWQTIMGSYGYRTCEFIEILPPAPYVSQCERIGYFSNPNLTYGGITLGDSDRNMKQHLEVTMPEVSLWNDTLAAVPDVPTPIIVVAALCYGLNIVIWEAESFVTEYRLYSSLSSNFANPVLIYNGLVPTADINVFSNNTWYLRAQACNSGGCSAYTEQVSASWHNGCLGP